jgi:hypothetical protein
VCPAIETTLTMAPRRRSIIDGAAACEASTALLKLSASTSSRWASLSSRIPARPTSEPALLIRMSIGPSCAALSRTSEATPAALRTSASSATACPPAAMIRSRVCSAPLRLR